MQNYFLLDDKKIFFESGDSILKAALRAGNFIPHYCYHAGLSCSATCRMCLVSITDAKTNRTFPKLQTSCSASAQENLIVSTKNKAVEDARKAVMEFLLVNHPLDCAICDQSGECTLQDFSYEYGSGISMVGHEKRVYGPRNIGSFLELERNRCIHCTRCVRFTQEITNTRELGTFGRAHQLTVDTFVDKPLTDKFQGNLADICPVGAITLKDFRFRKRSWKLNKVDSICDQCATGCNVYLEHEKNKIYRIKPRENQSVNRWWMCDYGRVNFHTYYDDSKTQLQPTENGNVISKDDALSKSSEFVLQHKENLIVINAGQSTVEEAFALKSFVQTLTGNSDKIYYPKAPDENKPSPVWIENLISNDKTPNKNGLKMLGFNELDEKKLAKIAPANNAFLIIGNLSLEFQKILANVDSDKIIQATCIKNNLMENKGICLPLTPYISKRGHFVNRQKFIQKINPVGFVDKRLFEECDLWSKLAHSVDMNNDVPQNPAESIAKAALIYPDLQKLVEKTKQDNVAIA